ncbi:MAG: hypothetical protein ACLSCV_08085 [Acutalibacteraceae bacterium]
MGIFLGYPLKMLWLHYEQRL